MDRVPASRARSRLGSLHDRGMVSGATAPSKRLSPGEFTTQPSQKRSMAAASVLVAASEQAVAISGRSAAEVLLAMGWQPSVIKTATEGGRSDTSPTMIEDALIKVWGTNAEAESLVEVLREALVRHKHRDFIGYWIFDTLYPMGAWKYVSYVQFALLVEELRAVLRAREFQAGDRLAIISRNSVEWAAFAFATWGLRGVLVPLYEEQQETEWSAIVADSGAKIVVAGNKDIFVQVQALRGATESIGKTGETTASYWGSVTEVICVDSTEGYLRNEPLALSEVLRKLREDQRQRGAVKAGAPAEVPEELPCGTEDAVWIYSLGSTRFARRGTGGVPRRVPVTHSQAVANLLALEPLAGLNRRDVTLSLLAWSTPAGLIGDLLLTARAGAAVAVGEGRSRVRANCEEVRATRLTLQPEEVRSLEAQLLYDVELQVHPAVLRLARRLARCSPELLPPTPRSRSSDAAPVAAAPAPAWLRLLFWAVDMLLGGRLKIIVAAGSTRGLDASKVGEAGLLGETGLRGFQGIEELYSVAEGVLGVRRGWAGGRGGAGIHPVVGAALEVQPLTPPGAAGDGVLSVRAPFLKDPLVTGDVASLSDAGVVELQGRASDAGVLAGGGRVSPARAEDALLAQPWVSQAAVVSEGRPFPVVLVVPVFEQLQKAECARLGSERLQSEAQLVAPGCPARSEVDRQVAAALAVLATHPQVAAHEVPRAAAILPERFQVQHGTITPCGQPRLHVIEQRFKDTIDRLYEHAKASQ